MSSNPDTPKVHYMQFAQIGGGRKYHLLAVMPESTYRVGMRCATRCDRTLMRTVKRTAALPIDAPAVCTRCLSSAGLQRSQS